MTHTEVTVPPTVDIPAGQSFVTVDLNAVNDFTVDGIQTATITASANSFLPASDSVDVTDINVADVVIRQNPSGVQVYEGADISESPRHHSRLGE